MPPPPGAFLWLQPKQPEPPILVSPQEPVLGADSHGMEGGRLVLVLTYFAWVPTSTSQRLSVSAF